MQTTLILPTNETTAKFDGNDSTRKAVCDETSCSHEATRFDSDQMMFVCETHEAVGKSSPASVTTITYQPSTISILGTDIQFSVILAMGTGLAYSPYEEGTYCVWHLAAKRVLSNRVITSEQGARAWIEQLVELADWIGEQPHLRSTNDLTDLLTNASITMLLRSEDSYTTRSNDSLIDIDTVQMDHATSHSTHREEEVPEVIDYIPCTMPFPDELFPGYTIEVIAAGDTGLGYVKHLDTYTIAHLPAQDLLILDWFVESEELARTWIEELVALADWTREVPKFRDAECLKEMISFACIGMLTEGDLSISQISPTVL